MRSNTSLSRRAFLQIGSAAALASTCMTGLPRVAQAAGAEPQKGRYVCPPCGLPCDKLPFDAPGSCPNCSMKLVPADGGADSPPAVSILLFNGAQLIDFAGPWEVFGTAGFLVHTVADKVELLTAVFGERIMPEYSFD